MTRHFIDLDQVPPAALQAILAQAHQIKAQPKNFRRLDGETLALIFEKPSTRTRVSFEVGIRELGGDAVVLTGAEMQLGRGETIGDTARVMSRYVDAIMIRTGDPHKVDELVAGANIPIINGLTNATHPCQVMADVMTLQERFGKTDGLRVAWVGDGENNILNSLIQAAAVFRYHLHIAAPAALAPARERIAAAQAKGARISCGEDAVEAARGANAIVTDTWVSMHNTDAAQRHAWRIRRCAGPSVGFNGKQQLRCGFTAKPSDGNRVCSGNCALWNKRRLRYWNCHQWRLNLPNKDRTQNAG